jgi:hypothetical protein
MWLAWSSEATVSWEHLTQYWVQYKLLNPGYTGDSMGWGVGVLDLGVRDLVELALIWWDESQSLLEFREYTQDRLKYIVHRARHGDVNAQLYTEILDWAHETKLALVKMFLENTRKLPVYEWARAHPEFPEERQYHPLERLQVKLETLLDSLLDEMFRWYYIRGDRDGFVSLFLRLPYKLRKHYLEKPYVRRLIGEFIEPEILEVLDKARVEVKVVLNVEDVIPLIKMYGSNWREKLREIVRTAISMGVARGG